MVGRILLLLGGIGMVASPFLPWISVNLLIVSPNLSLYDMATMLDEYGAFAEVLTIGIFTLAGGFLRVARVINLNLARLWGIIGGGAGFVEVIYRYAKFEHSFGAQFGLASLEMGFYLLAIASVLAIAGIIVDRE